MKRFRLSGLIYLGDGHESGDKFLRSCQNLYEVELALDEFGVFGNLQKRASSQ